MRINEVPPRDARPLIAEMHGDLVALLGSLRDAEWAAPTEAGRWTVKDVALHLLDGDLTQLSIGRDGSPCRPVDTAWRETSGWPHRCWRSGASSSEPGSRRHGIGAACAAFTAWL
jgi:hypothetical protein